MHDEGEYVRGSAPEIDRKFYQEGSIPLHYTHDFSGSIKMDRVKITRIISSFYKHFIIFVFR